MNLKFFIIKVEDYYKMKKQSFNKHDKVAMIACMNKLVKVIHFLVNTENLYDYTKSPQSLSSYY